MMASRQTPEHYLDAAEAVYERDGASGLTIVAIGKEIGANPAIS